MIWFAFTGVSAGLFQILFLAGWLQLDNDHRLGNLVSFLAACQVNFVMNQAMTWRETLRDTDRPHVALRWLRFHGAILGTGVLNQVLFNVLVTWLPALPSVALAIALVGVCNYFLLNSLVFGKRHQRVRHHVAPRPARLPRYLLDARAN